MFRPAVAAQRTGHLGDKGLHAIAAPQLPQINGFLRILRYSAVSEASGMRSSRRRSDCRLRTSPRLDMDTAGA